MDEICKHLSIKNKNIIEKNAGFSIVDRIRKLEGIYEKRSSNLGITQKANGLNIDKSSEKDVNDNDLIPSIPCYKKNGQELTMPEFSNPVNSQNVIERIQIFEGVLRDVLKETNVHSEMIEYFSDFTNQSFEKRDIEVEPSYRKDETHFSDKSINEINSKIENLRQKLESQLGSNNEFMNVKFPDLKQKLESLNSDFLILSSDYKKIKEDNFDTFDDTNLPSQEEEEKDKGKHIENSDLNNIEPISKINPTKKQFLKDPRVAKAISELQKQVDELKSNLEIVKKGPVHLPSEIMEIISKSKDLIEISEQFASKLDVRSLNTLLNDLNYKVEEFKLRLETSLGTKKVPYDEFEEVRQKANSIDTRLQASSKNIKMLETRINDMIFVPQSANTNANDLGGGSLRDVKLDAMSDEFNDKLANIRDQIKNLKSDIYSFNSNLTSRVNSKVGTDVVIELENKIYKELDKVISTLTRKISTKVEISRLYIVEGNVKKLLLQVFPELKADPNEAEYKKRPDLLNCASCESNLVNLCMLQQKASYNPWNRFPNKEFEDKYKANTQISFKSPKYQGKIKHSLILDSDGKMPRKIDILNVKKNDTYRDRNELKHTSTEKEKYSKIPFPDVEKSKN